MRTPLTLYGQRFGRLTVICKNPVSTASNNSRWDCICDCGTSCTVVGSKLISGYTSSCGCFHLERLRESVVTHGMRFSSEYNIWSGIKDRCLTPTNPAYGRYGGRGITICDRWRDSFENFYADMGPRPSPEHSVERKENDSGYGPNNCVWATATEQANNRRSNVFYEHGGVKKTVSELAREFDMSDVKLRKRLYRGWDLNRSLTQP